ncbi:hypothetical protein BC828DRAFT_177734 [Blastocladiella britannica]|nr:hypothetical protein BC828DRAFT_177734 [Blastocladiella britannica]
MHSSALAYRRPVTASALAATPTQAATARRCMSADGSHSWQPLELRSNRTRGNLGAANNLDEDGFVHVFSLWACGTSSTWLDLGTGKVLEPIPDTAQKQKRARAMSIGPGNKTLTKDDSKRRLAHLLENRVLRQPTVARPLVGAVASAASEHAVLLLAAFAVLVDTTTITITNAAATATAKAPIQPPTGTGGKSSTTGNDHGKAEEEDDDDVPLAQLIGTGVLVLPVPPTKRSPLVATLATVPAAAAAVRPTAPSLLETKSVASSSSAAASASSSASLARRKHLKQATAAPAPTASSQSKQRSSIPRPPRSLIPLISFTDNTKKAPDHSNTSRWVAPKSWKCTQPPPIAEVPLSPAPQIPPLRRKLVGGLVPSGTAAALAASGELHGGGNPVEIQRQALRRPRTMAE